MTMMFSPDIREDAVSQYDSGLKAFPIMPVEGQQKRPSSPKAHNVFTVSYACKAPAAGVEDAEPAREDMLEQELAVKAYRAELHEAFVAKHEAAATLSAAAKEAAVKMLVREAAMRDVSLAQKEGYTAEVLAFMRQTWQTFLGQVAAFFTETPEEAGAMTGSSAQQRNGSALESISSIGIWFHGPFISLPLRRYTIQVVGNDNALQLAVVVGLVSFCYSSYVMQTRSAAQQATLIELARLQEQLGTPCHFVPQLLLSPQ